MRPSGEGELQASEVPSGSGDGSRRPGAGGSLPARSARRRLGALGAALLLQGLAVAGLIAAFAPALVGRAPVPVIASIVPARRPPPRSLPILPEVSLPGMHAPRITVPPLVMPAQPPPLDKSLPRTAAITPELEASPTPSEIASFQALVRRALQIAVNSHYPKAARRRRQQGVAWVSFVYFNGTVSAIKLVRSSGLPLLDHAALATVRDARYPLPPPELAGYRLPWVVSVAFRLRAVR